MKGHPQIMGLSPQGQLQCGSGMKELLVIGSRQRGRTNRMRLFTGYFSDFSAALVCVERYHSNVRVNPSSKATCGW